MTTLGGLGFAGVVLASWIGLGWWIGRQNDKRLAAAREGMSREAFVEALRERDVDDDVATQTYDWIAAYYGPETTPNATDRMKGDISIDPEDMEFFVADFFRDNEMPQPTRKRPEILPDYGEVTLTSFAVYLSQRRATFRSKERIEV